MQIKISTMIASETPLTEEEAAIVDALIPLSRHAKGDIILHEGRIARACYFIIEGCIRSYQIKDGVERTTQFFIEGDPVASLHSYLNKVPATHYLACVEDCLLAVLTEQNEKELYAKIPKMESLCRISIEQEFGKQQEVMQHYLTKNPEERYLLLKETRPELLQRIPQYHLATYLGVQPESLSRIRKRIATREQH